MNHRVFSYLVGFVISLALTVIAFSFVWFEVFRSSAQLVGALLLLLALAQLVVQMVFFLHIGTASAWSKMTLIFSFLIVLCVVGGSLWIMAHLEHSTHIPFDGSVSPQHEH